MAAGEVSFNDLTNPIVTVTGVVYPEEPGLSYPMAASTTFGGHIKTFDFGDGSTNWDIIPITFANMTNADYVLLRDFIVNTVDWHEISFTYTDPLSTAYTNMHYMSGLETFRSSIGRRWGGRIVIRKDMAA